jgi:molecular chaperone HscB
VAAAQASPRNLNCFHCRAALEGFLSRHVCAQCGYPQPVASGEDYFGAFGVPRRFSQNRAEIEKRFYEISRALHPDRFTTAGPEARKHSLERMSFLNEAYRTLRNPELLREYFLEQEGLKQQDGKTQQAPLELAESWFELQDALSDNPEEASAKVAEFARTLAESDESARRTVVSLEREIDEQPSRALLEKLAHMVGTQSYLKSMQRDVEKLKQRYSGK